MPSVRGVSIVLFSFCLACGSSEPPPEITPVPTELATPELATPETPTPETPTPELTAEAAETPTPVEPTPPRDDSPLPDPPEAPAPTFTELGRTEQTFEMHHLPVQYDQVAYPAPVQEALLRQLRGVVRDLTETYDPSMADEYFEPSFTAGCDATLALPELVSYLCTAYIETGRGAAETYVDTRLWAIDGEAVREVENDDFLVEGVDWSALEEAYEIDVEGLMYLTPNSVGWVDWQGETAVIPYAHLGTLLSPSSAVMRVPGVSALAAIETPLSARAGPPDTITVALPARPIGEAALSLARTAEGSGWLFPAQVGGVVDVGASAVVRARPAPGAAAGAVEERPWSTPLCVEPRSLRRATQLRPGPRRPPSGDALPRGTAVWVILGDTGAGPSRTGGGQWTLVAASAGRVGWVPSGVITTGAGGDALRALDAVRAVLPEAERSTDAIVASVTGGIGPGVVVIAAGEGRTTVGLSTGVVPSVARLVVRGTGRLLEAWRVRTSASTVAELLVTRWLRPEDGGQSRLVAHAVPASGTEAGAPVLDVLVAGPDAPARERVTIATELTRRGSYYPLVVRGPGRSETLYTWSGSALVAPTPE